MATNDWHGRSCVLANGAAIQVYVNRRTHSIHIDACRDFQIRELTLSSEAFQTVVAMVEQLRDPNEEYSCAG